MRSPRRLTRLMLLTPWTLGWFVLWLCGSLLAVPAGRLTAWRARVQQGWSRGMCRILGVRISVSGPVPQGGCLLVANHLSYVDVLVLGSLLPCAFVAKAEIARWPLIGFLARAMGTLFVARERQRSLKALNERLAARLAQGHALVLFPEGTSSSGEQLLPFRAGLLEPAAALALPVRFAAMRYTTAPGARPAREVVCWWGERAFVAHVFELLGLARIDARVVFGANPITAPDRKLLAARLQRAVGELFEPLLPGEIRDAALEPSPMEQSPCAPRAG